MLVPDTVGGMNFKVIRLGGKSGDRFCSTQDAMLLSVDQGTSPVGFGGLSHG